MVINESLIPVGHRDITKILVDLSHLVCACELPFT